MKHLILCLLGSFLISTCIAQNGGQYPENGSVKLEYIGSGKVKVYNKQSCNAVIKVNDGKTEAELTIPGNSFSLYAISAGLTTNFTVKAKTTTNCGYTDFGMVELFIASLPVTFKSVYADRISGNTFWVNWQIGDPKNVSHYNIQRSKDGKTWETVTVVLGDDIQTNFKIKTDLTSKNK